MIINLYLEPHTLTIHNLRAWDPKVKNFEKIDSIEIDDDVRYEYLLNIDNARMYIIGYLKNSFFEDLEYRISTKCDSNNQITIDVYFRHNISIDREVKIKKVLND